jgi:hypothetical protein
MPRFKDGMKTRKCGCIYFEVGPPVKCTKHATREQELEEIGLRKAVRDTAETLGHSLTRFSEYESLPGKWTAFCEHCERVVIVYDKVPERGDQINGRRILEERCHP